MTKGVEKGSERIKHHSYSVLAIEVNISFHEGLTAESET
jgi:hypothetical protein